jgi:hypothetical protein
MAVSLSYEPPRRLKEANLKGFGVPISGPLGAALLAAIMGAEEKEQERVVIGELDQEEKVLSARMDGHIRQLEKLMQEAMVLKARLEADKQELWFHVDRRLGIPFDVNGALKDGRFVMIPKDDAERLGFGKNGGGEEHA